MPSNQQQFEAFFKHFVNNIQAIEVDLHRLLKYIDSCRSESQRYESNDSVVASEYLFCGSIACLCRLLDIGMDASVLQKGKELIGHACTLLPEDKEYRLYNLLYSIFDINPNNGRDAFQTMKDIYKKCPSFRLLDKNCLSAEWAEDRFIQSFSLYLTPVVENLMKTADADTCIEACTLLATMPQISVKLKAYTYQSRILFGQYKLEESLRTAKLGVELLGFNHPYNHKEEMSLLWAECWTRVATCNRAKKEYDFAMSLYEKGASNGIPECIHLLGEMYERGESEDADPKMAEELYQKACSLKNMYEQEMREEQEKLEQEKKAEEERIRKEKERIRLESEKRQRLKALAQLKKKNKTEKILIPIFCVCLLVGCYLGISFLGKPTAKDVLYDYVKQKTAIIDYSLDDQPFIILMNHDGIFYDNLKAKNKIIPVGEKMPLHSLGVFPLSEGPAYLIPEIEGGWTITTSKSLGIKKIANSSFLFYHKGTEDSDTRSFHDCYLLVNNKDTMLVLHLEKATIEGSVVHMSTTSDLLTASSCADRLNKEFNSNEMNEIKSLEMSTFHANIDFDVAEKMKTSINGAIYFPYLDRTFYPAQFNEKTVLNTFVKDARVLIAGQLTDNILSKLINLDQTTQLYCSPDKKSTFASVLDYAEKHDIYSLYMIDNAKRTSKLVEHAKAIEYLPDKIHLIKHGKVLLLFNSNKHVYYDYYGNML